MTSEPSSSAVDEVARKNKRVAKILKLEGNGVCADCPTEKPLWLSFLKDGGGDTPANLKVEGALCALVCDNCAPLHHFELGKEYCSMKYLKYAHEWSNDELDAVERSGNAIVNKCYEAVKMKFDKKNTINPVKEEEFEARGKFIRNKYVKRKHRDDAILEKTLDKMFKRGAYSSSSSRDKGRRSSQVDDGKRSSSRRDKSTEDDKRSSRKRSKSRDKDTRSSSRRDKSPNEDKMSRSKEEKMTDEDKRSSSTGDKSKEDDQKSSIRKSESVNGDLRLSSRGDKTTDEDKRSRRRRDRCTDEDKQSNMRKSKSMNGDLRLSSRGDKSTDEDKRSSRRNDESMDEDKKSNMRKSKSMNGDLRLSSRGDKSTDEDKRSSRRSDESMDEDKKSNMRKSKSMNGDLRLSSRGDKSTDEDKRSSRRNDESMDEDKKSNMRKSKSMNGDLRLSSRGDKSMNEEKRSSSGRDKDEEKKSSIRSKSYADDLRPSRHEKRSSRHDEDKMRSSHRNEEMKRSKHKDGEKDRSNRNADDMERSSHADKGNKGSSHHKRSESPGQKENSPYSGLSSLVKKKQDDKAAKAAKMSESEKKDMVAKMSESEMLLAQLIDDAKLLKLHAGMAKAAAGLGTAVSNGTDNGDDSDGKKKMAKRKSNTGLGIGKLAMMSDQGMQQLTKRMSGTKLEFGMATGPKGKKVGATSELESWTREGVAKKKTCDDKDDRHAKLQKLTKRMSNTKLDLKKAIGSNEKKGGATLEVVSWTREGSAKKTCGDKERAKLLGLASSLVQKAS